MACPRGAVNSILLTTYEDVEQQNEFDLLQIVEDLLGGYWEKPLASGKAGATACLISSARPLPGHFSRAFKSMGLAPSC